MPILYARIRIASAFASNEPSLVGDVRAFVASKRGCIKSVDWTNTFVYVEMANMNEDAVRVQYPGCVAAYDRPAW